MKREVFGILYLIEYPPKTPKNAEKKNTADRIKFS